MNDSWTIFKTYSSLETAEIDKGLLEANGIPCVINNATIASVYPMTDTWTPLQMLISADKLDEARELIKA